MTPSAYDACKRSLDVTGGLALLLASAPLLVLAALAIRVTMGSPVIYQQQRAGQRGRLFTLFKLRTMRDVQFVDGRPLSDGDRLTALGRWLRATSLDELPGLWNVVRGDMSLVGPRPLLPEYLDRYSPEQARRHEVLPGVTGLAQTSGRNAISWDEKFALDVWYVDHRSLSLDLSILWRTAGVVLRRRGIGASGVATMPEFYPASREASEDTASAEQHHTRTDGSASQPPAGNHNRRNPCAIS